MGFGSTVLSRWWLSPVLVHLFLPHYSFHSTFHELVWIQHTKNIFWTCHVSSLHHDCVAFWTRSRDHLKAEQPFAGAWADSTAKQTIIIKIPRNKCLKCVKWIKGRFFFFFLIEIVKEIFFFFSVIFYGDTPVYQRKHQNNGIFITLSEMH